MTACPFCLLAEEGLPPYGLYEDERFLVILNPESLGEGHCLVIPKQHVVTVYDLDQDDYRNLFSLARWLAAVLERATGTKAVGYLAFGSGLPHAHLHLVPHSTPEVLLHPHPRLLSDEQLRDQADQLRPLLAEWEVADASEGDWKPQPPRGGRWQGA